MAGYYYVRLNEGTHDDLHAKAIVIEGDGGKVAWSRWIWSAYRGISLKGPLADRKRNGHFRQSGDD